MKRIIISRQVERGVQPFFGHVMGGELKTCCDNWNDKRKSSRGKQRERIMDGLTKWQKLGSVTDAG